MLAMVKVEWVLLLDFTELELMSESALGHDLPKLRKPGMTALRC